MSDFKLDWIVQELREMKMEVFKLRLDLSSEIAHIKGQLIQMPRVEYRITQHHQKKTKEN